MSEQASCPNCKRELVGQHNFCPYCGCDLRGQAMVTANPEPLRAVTPPPPQSTSTPPPPAPDKQKSNSNKVSTARPSPTRRFQLLNLRAIWGLFDLIAIPLLILLAVLVIRSGLNVPGMGDPPPPLACDHLDAAEFTPTKFERGLGGELEEDTSFTANTEYLIQTVLVVPQNRRLLVQPGARLEFEEGAGIDVQGALYICGTEKEPVTLTAETGEPGSWQGIRFLEADDSSMLAHALVQFAGDRAIYLENSAPALLDVKIASSSAFPISSDGSKIPLLLDGVEFDKNPFEGIEIRGGQTADTQNITWPNQGFAYVLSGPVTIGENSTLTIEPGSNVKFWYSGQGEQPGLLVRGLLKAEDVRFTSVYDGRDEVGGVTYKEARDPQPGDWAGLTFADSSSQSFLRNALVQYAGNGQGAISLQNSSPELSNVTIADSAWYPLSADADSFPTLSQITLLNNEPGDALEVRGGSAITGRERYTWAKLGNEAQIVRVIRGDVTVEPEATLVIEPGVVIKFEPESRLTIEGTLEAIGGENEDDRIIFTSLRDDEYGGVTDKNTGPQDPRGWDGLVFDQADESSILQNALVRYGSVAFNDATPRLQNVIIRDSESAALWATPNANPTFNNLQLQDNATNGLAITDGTLNKDQTWTAVSNGDQPLVRILSGGLTVAEGATLQIQPGVIVKADEDGRLIINGGLQARGDGSQPIIFTSLHDDSEGGDTNQQLQEANAGDWPGLEIGAQADVVIGEVTIRFARDGLFLRGGNTLAVNGLLRLMDGVNAVRCDSESDLPSAIVADGNEVNDLACPSP